MSIKKLAIGDHITFRCKKITLSTTGTYPDYIFDTERGESYSAPKGAIDRQLERMGLTLDQAAGNVFRLERAPNKDDPKKSWWNLSTESDHGLEAPAPSKRVAGPSSVPGEAPERYKAPVAAPNVTVAATSHSERQGGVTLDDVASAYKWAWGHAEKVQSEGTAAETMVSATHIQAGAATLLIALQKEGLMRGFAHRSFDKAVRDTFDLPDPESEEADGPAFPF